MARADYNAKARAYFKRCGYESIAKVEIYRVDPPGKDAPPGQKGFGRFHDLFGCLDFLVVGNGETIGAQICQAGDISKRLAKVTASPPRNKDDLPGPDHVMNCLAAGWRILVIGFRPGQSAPHRIVEVTRDAVLASRARESVEESADSAELPF